MVSANLKGSWSSFNQEMCQVCKNMACLDCDVSLPTVFDSCMMQILNVFWECATAFLLVKSRKLKFLRATEAKCDS